MDGEDVTGIVILFSATMLPKTQLHCCWSQQSLSLLRQAGLSSSSSFLEWKICRFPSFLCLPLSCRGAEPGAPRVLGECLFLSPSPLSPLKAYLLCFFPSPHATLTTGRFVHLFLAGTYSRRCRKTVGEGATPPQAGRAQAQVCRGPRGSPGGWDLPLER